MSKKVIQSVAHPKARRTRTGEEQVSCWWWWCSARARDGEKVRLDSRRRLAALWRARRSEADREARGRPPREKSVRAGRLDDQRHPSETRPPDEVPRRRQRSEAAPPARRTKLGATLGPCAFAPDADRWRAVAHAPEELASALAPARGIARETERVKRGRSARQEALRARLWRGSSSRSREDRMERYDAQAEVSRTPATPRDASRKEGRRSRTHTDRSVS